jgi:hypothetical protein
MSLLLAALLPQAAVDDARDALRDWQARMIRDRQRATPELRRILAHKIDVPPPPPPGMKADLTPVRLDFGSMDPLGLLPLAPAVSARIGEPVTRVQTEAKAAFFDFFAAEVKNLHWVSTDDGRGAFHESEVLWGVDAGPGGPYRPFGKALFGISSREGVTRDGPKRGVELSSGWWAAEFGLDDEELEVAGKFGPRMKLYGGALDVGAQVSVELAAPAVVDDVQWRSRWGLAQVASGMVERIGELMADVGPCAYCAGRGAIVCRRCSDARTIGCPGCARSGRVACGDCSGQGEFSCPTTKPCGRCEGMGVGGCGGCGGGGSTTVYDSVTVYETRTRKEMVRVAWDENRRPIYEMRTYTEEVAVPKTVSRSAPCGACGGSGQGGACGSCGGAGERPCGRCRGSGRARCGECGASGSKLCRTCSGAKDLPCPTCPSGGFSCPLCRGRGKAGR